MTVLAASFLLTAILYAAAGFGGGSTYNAILVLAGVDFTVLVPVALACNLTVVSGSSVRFAKAGLLRLTRITPFVFTSIPAAWLAARMPIAKETFVLLLGLSLIAAAVLLWFEKQIQPRAFFHHNKMMPWAVGLPTGAALGGMAGLVGIGGGIFLSPVLNLMRFDNPKIIAASAAFFILVNSTAGLAGQLTKLDTANQLSEAFAYAPLLIAVFIGGQLGSHFAVNRLSSQIVRRLTALLIGAVGIRLLNTWWEFTA
ncbi:MAG: sulfite exporter TauE/SafE family protein [Gammaproteobacteria bacterium]